MRALVGVILVFLVIAFAAVSIAATRLVDRHYDYLTAEQENTKLERRIEAMHTAVGSTADDDTGDLNLLFVLVLVPMVMVLATTLLVGQGGLSGLASNLNKLARIMKSKGQRQQHQTPASNRYVVQTTEPRQLTSGRSHDEDEDKETIRWV